MNLYDPRPFDGIYIPLITPFLVDGGIDWISLKRLVAHYAGLGVAGFVPCGSTGEASTLTMEEHKAIISFVLDEAARHGRFRIIAATGSNDTRDCLELTEHAHAAGADACLVVTPYYVRPNRAGLRAHYEKIAEVGIDLLLYNIPLRAGLNLSLDDIVDLVEAVPRIIGIKRIRCCSTAVCTEAGGQSAQPHWCTRAKCWLCTPTSLLVACRRRPC